MELWFSEIMWGLVDTDRPVVGDVYLGEAGNPSRHPSDWVQAVRLGDEVLVAGTNRDFVIPDSVVLDGFLMGRDGRTLRDVMEEGVVYNHCLFKAG